MGLLSGILGSILAFGGVAAVNEFLIKYEFRLELTLALIAASNLTALLIATAAGLYPAWRASRMTPMDAIRNEAS